MVYYIYELRWASSDNTLKELDASGSFFIVICAWLYCIVISIQYFLLYRKDRLWRSVELKIARTNAGMTNKRLSV